MEDNVCDEIIIELEDGARYSFHEEDGVGSFIQGELLIIYATHPLRQLNAFIYDKVVRQTNIYRRKDGK